MTDELVGREFAAASPYAVTQEAVDAFATATGWTGQALPPTFPIVVAFQAMADFMVTGGLELSRVVHGDQRFTYERPLAVGDTLSATLTVDKVRAVQSNDFYGTTTRITDQSGSLVCTASATLVHRGLSDESGAEA